MATVMRITETRFCGTNQPCFIIAEIGQNHQGCIETSKELVKVAKNSGADAVKFQKTCLNEKFTRAALDMPYRDNPNSWGSTYEQHKIYLEFSESEFRELREYAREIGILFGATAMDHLSLQFIRDIGVDFVKIGSGDATNIPLLRKAASCENPLIISTGMKDESDVQLIYDTVRHVYDETKNNNTFALLHCLSSYPAPIDEINLKVIPDLAAKYDNIVVGYSGHEIGTEISIAALAMGAAIIERHITLDKNQIGSDHRCSLLPHELASLVASIRVVERAMGSPAKKFQASELPCFNKLSKSIVAGRDLKSGQTLGDEDIAVKVSPEKGIPDKDYDSLIDKVILMDVGADEPIKYRMIVAD